MYIYIIHDLLFQKQGRTLSQMEQFWAYMLEGDKLVEEKDFEYSVLVSLLTYTE